MMTAATMRGAMMNSEDISMPKSSFPAHTSVA